MLPVREVGLGRCSEWDTLCHYLSQTSPEIARSDHLSPSRPMPRRNKPAVATSAIPSTVPNEFVILPLQRQTVTGMTTDAIRERILRGRYQEGQPLRQDAIGIEL